MVQREEWVRVEIDISSILGQVLAGVIGDETIKIVGGGDQPLDDPPDVLLLDLDVFRREAGSRLYDGKAPVVVLAFAAAPKAKLELPPLKTDCRALRFLQKPCSLSELRRVIKAAPKGYERIYRHPGVNLTCQIKTASASSLSQQQETMFLQKLHGLYPALHGKTIGDLNACAAELPIEVLFSFYRGLAHEGGHRGLMGALTEVHGCAVNCHTFQNDPNRSELMKQRFRDAAVAFFNAPEREAFHERVLDIEGLLEIVDAGVQRTMIADFHGRHQGIDRQLISVEEQIGAALDHNDADFNGIRTSTIDVIQGLTKLLEQLKLCKEHKDEMGGTG
jgi:hypothetical protein